MEAHGRAWEYEAATLVRGGRLEPETRTMGGRTAVEVAQALQVAARGEGSGALWGWRGGGVEKVVPWVL